MKKLLYALFFLTCFLLDRISKLCILKYITEPKLITDYFNLSIAWNKGVSWSLLSFDSMLGKSLLTAFILCVIVCFSIYTLIQLKNRHNIMFEVMVLAGALSNVVDRFLYGAVLDFLEFHLQTWYWPTFNVADIFVVVGVFGIILKNMYEIYVVKN
ncbi:MAG: signal peptidase II [bacterium]